MLHCTNTLFIHLFPVHSLVRLGENFACIQRGVKRQPAHLKTFLLDVEPHSGTGSPKSVVPTGEMTTKQKKLYEALDFPMPS